MVLQVQQEAMVVPRIRAYPASKEKGMALEHDDRHQTGHFILKMMAMPNQVLGFTEPVVTAEEAREMLAIVYPEFSEILTRGK